MDTPLGNLLILGQQKNPETQMSQWDSLLDSSQMLVPEDWVGQVSSTMMEPTCTLPLVEFQIIAGIFMETKAKKINLGS